MEQGAGSMEHGVVERKKKKKKKKKRKKNCARNLQKHSNTKDRCPARWPVLPYSSPPFYSVSQPTGLDVTIKLESLAFHSQSVEF